MQDRRQELRAKRAQLINAALELEKEFDELREEDVMNSNHSNLCAVWSPAAFVLLIAFCMAWKFPLFLSLPFALRFFIDGIYVFLELAVLAGFMMGILKLAGFLITHFRREPTTEEEQQP